MYNLKLKVFCLSDCSGVKNIQSEIKRKSVISLVCYFATLLKCMTELWKSV